MDAFNVKMKADERTADDILGAFPCLLLLYSSHILIYCILAVVMQGWKMDDPKSVYNKYKIPPTIEVGDDGIVKYVFECLVYVFDLQSA